MATQKLYAGVKLQEIRSRPGVTQKSFAEKLGVSLPYLSPMENNHRPDSAGVVLALAQETRHDLERMADLFGALIKQVAHRLSTLQRSGAKCVPFFFVRVDQAGTISKRHSATRLQFARFGGACPLWNVHRAFETPGRFLRQLAETPDGMRYPCLARDVSKPSGGFKLTVRRYAIRLGCEITHADCLVYADDLNVSNRSAYQAIGISCRICERRNCHQRSAPPLEGQLSVNHNLQGILPYQLG